MQYSEKTCPRAAFVHHKSHMRRSDVTLSNLSRRGGKLASNSLSYDTASGHMFMCLLSVVTDMLSKEL
jgi:hypothetical protein